MVGSKDPILEKKAFKKIYKKYFFILFTQWKWSYKTAILEQLHLSELNETWDIYSYKLCPCNYLRQFLHIFKQGVLPYMFESKTFECDVTSEKIYRRHPDLISNGPIVQWGMRIFSWNKFKKNLPLFLSSKLFSDQNSVEISQNATSFSKTTTKKNLVRCFWFYSLLVVRTCVNSWLHMRSFKNEFSMNFRVFVPLLIPRQKF